MIKFLLLWSLLIVSVSADAHRFAPSLLQIKASGGAKLGHVKCCPIG